MTTLTDFLLARIAEDEAVARNVKDGPPQRFAAVGYFGLGQFDPDRVLAECEAKRLLLEFARFDDWTDPNYAGSINAPGADRGDVLVALALPYAGHPDYDPTWRPGYTHND